MEEASGSLSGGRPGLTPPQAPGDCKAWNDGFPSEVASDLSIAAPKSFKIISETNCTNCVDFSCIVFVLNHLSTEVARENRDYV